MNKKIENMFERENMEREARARLKEKQNMFINNSKKMVVVGATTLVLVGALNCSPASAYDRYDDSSYRGVGYMCYSDEIGTEGNAGFVSKGTGDYGGISYGMYQFSTTTGSAQDFVNWSKTNSPEIYKIFKEAGNPKAGTPKFGSAWKKCYDKLEGKFEDAQTEFAMAKIIEPGYENVKNETGIDLKKSRARTEFLVSTATQFGPKGILNLFNEVKNKGVKINNDMDDQKLLDIMCQHKYDTVNYHFRSSNSDVKYSARLRFKREKKELLKIAKEESGPKLDEIDTNQIQVDSTKKSIGKKTSKKQIVNNTADKYQDKGITYDFGEKNVKSGSLDCSGLISQMMKDMGVDVDAGNTNALKFCNDSKEISKDEVQPGDLVFWHDDAGTKHNSVYHIGMYVGNDTIVDCSPSHNGVGTRKLSECKDTNSMHYSYGRYTKLENKMKNYAQKIVKSINEFDDVITVDNKDIEKDYEKVEKKVNDVKEEINENAKEEVNENEKEEVNEKEKEEVNEKEDIEDNEANKDTKQQEEKTDEPSLEDSEDSSDKNDEFESVIEEDKGDTPKENTKENDSDIEKDKNDSSQKDEDNKDKEQNNQENKDNKDKEIDNNKEENDSNASSLDNSLIIGDSHADALKDKVKDNENTEVEATVGASAYVYLNDTDYFGNKLIDKLPENSDKIDKVIISLGVNNIAGKSNVEDIKEVIDKVQDKYPGKDVYFMKVNHVGDKYQYGDVTETNKLIDNLNNEIEKYAKNKDKVTVIDASKDLEKDGKLTETNDGLHVKDNDKLIDNLEKGIKDNQENNETSLEDSEDSSNKNDEFESVIEEDNSNDSESSNKEEKDKEETETKSQKENDNDKEETKSQKDSSKDDVTVQDDKNKTTIDDNDKEETESQKDSSKDEVPVQDDKEETETESQKENKNKTILDDTDKEQKEYESQKENVKEQTKTESSKDEVPVQDDSNIKENKNRTAVDNNTKKENVKEQKEYESSKDEVPVQKENKNRTAVDNNTKKENTQMNNKSQSEQKENVKEQTKTESSKDEVPVQDNSTTKENSSSESDNSKVDELHSRLKNNLFGRIIMS